MTKQTSIGLSRRQVLAGLGTLGVATAGAGLGTTAFFRDDERLAGWYDAGLVDLKLDYRTTYRPWERYDLQQVPGDQRPPVIPGTGGMTYELAAVPRFNGENEPPLTHEEWGRLVREMVVCEGEPGYDRELDAQLVDGEAGMFVDLDDLKPKDEGETTFSLHLCGNPAYLLVRSLAEDGNGNPLPRFPESETTEPEREAGDDSATENGDNAMGDGELADYMHVTIFVDGDCDNREEQGADLVLYAGSLRGWLDLLDDQGAVALPGDSTALTGCFTPGAHCFVLRWVLPCDEADFRELPSHADAIFGFENVDGDDSFTFNDELRERGYVVTDATGTIRTANSNVTQTDGVHFGLGFRAVQCRHNADIGRRPVTPSGENARPATEAATTVGTTADDTGTTTADTGKTTADTGTTTADTGTTTDDAGTTSTGPGPTTNGPGTTTTTSDAGTTTTDRAPSEEGTQPATGPKNGRGQPVQFLPRVSATGTGGEFGCLECTLPLDSDPSDELVITSFDTERFPSVGVRLQTPPFRAVDLETGAVCEDGCGRQATLEQRDAGDQVDVVFLVDVSTNMVDPLGDVKARLTSVVDGIEADGYDARYAYVVYADDDRVSWDDATRAAVHVHTDLDDAASPFVNAGTFLAALEGTRPGDDVGFGGSDGSQDGYEAILAADSLSYREGAQRVIVQVTNSPNEEDGPGESRADAESVLADYTYVAVSSNLDGRHQPKSLAAATGGPWIHIDDGDWSAINAAVELGTRAEYVLWYVSPNEGPDGSEREVTVGVTVDGAVHHAHGAYGAP
ncbi:hypothetical protein [Haloarchaeobius sp. TZWWS8]|uniref:hypothetical protein n=1 Tax=Haloarchaeobius sp. TZWWS8 TaxID=3446121 RepID=UPI003EC11B78